MYGERRRMPDVERRIEWLGKAWGIVACKAGENKKVGACGGGKKNALTGRKKLGNAWSGSGL